MSFGDLDVETSDNYFNLLPNEVLTLTLKSASSIDQIKSSVKVISLTDAFEAK